MENSYPQFRDCIVEDNQTDILFPTDFAECGGGIGLQFDEGVATRAVVFSNCLIRGNTATWAGGGVYLYDTVGTPVVFSGCVITNNEAVSPYPNYAAYGGGLYLDAAGVSQGTVLSNSLIAWNFADAQGYGGWLFPGGAGVFASGHVTIDTCDIASNSVFSGHGAGAVLYAFTNAAPQLIASRIVGNVVTNGGNGAGVALFGDDSWPPSSVVHTTLVSRTTILGNRGANDGGGAYLDTLAAARIESSYWSGNQSRTNGGALYIEATNVVEIQNCTITSNTFGSAGGSLTVSGGSNVLIRNTILWGNGAKSVSLNNGLVTVSHSCVDQGYAGVGNTSIDPALVQGYRLRTPGSPCVGNGGAEGAVVVDLDGYVAQSEAAPDIGCSFFKFHDTDGDGLDDDWEQGIFGSLSHDGTADSDGDGATDAMEFADGTNPLYNPGDANGDGVNDDLAVWQQHAYLDSDGDGMPDGWEATHGLNPLVNDSKADHDGDGLSNEKEWLWGTNPSAMDSDGDGISDSDEITGAITGCPTDPANADTDGDGVLDGTDFAPLDPTVWLDPDAPGSLLLVIVEPTEGASL